MRQLSTPRALLVLLAATAGTIFCIEVGTQLVAVKEASSLAMAAAVGVGITLIQRLARADSSRARALDHAQILLCIAGALMTIIIGDSMARALGVVGGASIVRFRTPIKDPKDTAVLFLLLGLGMACGLGAFGIAVIGSIFLAAFLLVLGLYSKPAAEVEHKAGSAAAAAPPAAMAAAAAGAPR